MLFFEVLDDYIYEDNLICVVDMFINLLDLFDLGFVCC